MVQICNQLSESFIMSSIEHLYIIQEGDSAMFSSTLEDVMDETQWVELFHLFTAVQTLYISHMILSHVMSALQELSGESATEVLPVLDNLYLEEYRASGSEQHDIEPFIIAHQHSDHPASVHHWERGTQKEFE
jgi:hypothetical protein